MLWNDRLCRIQQGTHYFDLRFSLPEQIKKALDGAGVEIPFPHRKVIVFNGDKPGEALGAS